VAQQASNPKMLRINFPANKIGPEATSYKLYWRDVGETTWREVGDVTSSVKTNGYVDWQPNVGVRSMSFEFTATASSSGGTSAYANVVRGSADPYLPAPAGTGVTYSFMDGSFGLSINWDKMTVPDFDKHLTGLTIVVEKDGGGTTHVEKDYGWPGSQDDWFGLQPGESGKLTVYPITWGHIQGNAYQPVPISRPAPHDDPKPQIVNVDSPKKGVLTFSVNGAEKGVEMLGMAQPLNTKGEPVGSNLNKNLAELHADSPIAANDYEWDGLDKGDYLLSVQPEGSQVASDQVKVTVKGGII
jgi:hypothetical protein